MTEYHVPDIRIRDQVEDYWNSRANGYSISSNYYIQNDDGRLIRQISKHVNLNRSMRILDVGTGPGDTAIMFAKLGHRVTGLDLSEKMLEKARENAEKYGVDVEFVKGPAEYPPFAEGMFDMVVATSCVWSFQDPLKAYTAWKRLLRPGGYIVVYDGNHYLDLFDEDYKNRVTYMELKNGKDSNRHACDNVDGVDFNIIRDLAKELPMSRYRRPGWDVTAFEGLNAVEINITNMDKEPYYTLSANGYVAVPSKFLISARFSDIPDISSVRTVDARDAFRIKTELQDTDLSYIEVLKAIANDNRLRILVLLENGRMSLITISEILEMSQPLVSHHLGILKKNNLVYSERRGKETFYGLINYEKIADLLNTCRQTKEGLILGATGVWVGETE